MSSRKKVSTKTTKKGKIVRKASPDIYDLPLKPVPRLAREASPDIYDLPLKPVRRLAREASPDIYDLPLRTTEESPVKAKTTVKGVKITKKGAKASPVKNEGPKDIVRAAVMGDLQKVRLMIPKAKKNDIIEAYLAVKGFGSEAVVAELSKNKYVEGYEAARTPSPKMKMKWEHETGDWEEKDVATGKGRKKKPVFGATNVGTPLHVARPIPKAPKTTKDIKKLVKRMTGKTTLPKPKKRGKIVRFASPEIIGRGATPKPKAKSAKKLTALEIFNRESEKASAKRKADADAAAKTKALAKKKLLKSKGEKGEKARKLEAMSPKEKAEAKKEAIAKLKIKQEDEKKEARKERAATRKRRY